ncbi:MAG: thiamine pyrophosphate-binding protein [bacterium]|nr:thiamine pyrophosphate-binding protein [bacterium]
MAQLNGGDLVVAALAREGVTHMFTIVGGHNFEIVNACRAHGIRVIDVRHEQQAAHMADGWARFTGGIGVCTADAAPGLVNLFGGLQVAYESQVPMLVVTAQGSLQGRDIGVMQAIDQLEIVRPVTKWQRTCFEMKRIPEYVATAVRYATTGRPGPVFLDFPLELLRGKIEDSEVQIPEKLHNVARGYGDPADIQAALDLLSKAQRPLVIVGSGVHWSGAGKELCDFIEATGIPVLARNMARGFVPDDHPLALGMMPSGAAGADVYLVIGTRLEWTIGYGRPPLFAPDAKLIQVDVKPEVIGKTRTPDIGIVGDAKAVLTQLNTHVKDFSFSVPQEWQMRAKGSVAYMQNQAAENVGLAARPPERPMHSIQLVRGVKSWLDRESITVVDGGYIAAFALQELEARAPHGVMWVGITGHLGVGVAYANAAKLAHPDRTVVALMGDGSFGLCAMEFDTAVRHNIQTITVIANDQGWGEIRDGQRRRFGEEGVIASELGLTRYDQMAVALGGYGEFVEKPEDLAPALDRAVASGKPAIINVQTDPEQRSTTVSGMPWIIE